MNGFEKAVETVGKDALKVVEAPFTFAGKVEKVLVTAIKDQPELRDALKTLVQKSEAIAADGVKDIGERGLSLPDDLTTISAIEDLGSYVKATIVPLVEKLYGEIKADVAAAA